MDIFFGTTVNLSAIFNCYTGFSSVLKSLAYVIFMYSFMKQSGANAEMGKVYNM